MTGLFPEPGKLPHELSLQYSEGEFRGVEGRKPSWTTQKTGTYCDECMMCQHETPESLQRVRGKAVTKRKCGRTVLFLCGPHAELWKMRDQEDA